MKNINLTTAKKLCEEAGADGIILMAFINGNYISVSWGKNRLECERYGLLLDKINKKIDDGEIEP